MQHNYYVTMLNKQDFIKMIPFANYCFYKKGELILNSGSISIFYIFLLKKVTKYIF